MEIMAKWNFEMAKKKKQLISLEYIVTILKYIKYK